MSIVETETSIRMTNGKWHAAKRATGGGVWITMMNDAGRVIIAEEVADRVRARDLWEVCRLAMERVSQLGKAGPECSFGGSDE